MDGLWVSLYSSLCSFCLEMDASLGFRRTFFLLDLKWWWVWYSCLEFPWETYSFRIEGVNFVHPDRKSVV